jgi:hypothetical protein
MSRRSTTRQTAIEMIDRNDFFDRKIAFADEMNSIYNALLIIKVTARNGCHGILKG